MEKNRTSLIAIIFGFIFYSFSASAEEIEMTCSFKHKEFYGGQLQTKRLRYTDPFLSEKKILQFRDGKWRDWCRPLPAHHRPCKILISDKSALMTGYLKDQLSEPSFGKPKGYEIIKVIQYHLKFGPPKLFIDTHYETISGERLFGNVRDWERWFCAIN
tara:strand:+ start:11273 stop:11749 length:477 start_codon:yes stop_codon:yes gene_type:complete